MEPQVPSLESASSTYGTTIEDTLLADSNLHQRNPREESVYLCAFWHSQESVRGASSTS